MLYYESYSLRNCYLVVKKNIRILYDVTDLNFVSQMLKITIATLTWNAVIVI